MKSLIRISWALMLALVSCTRESGTDLPNFVWIVSEDNSTHYMELFDPHGIATPNLEKMADEGILFTRAFCNAPVCSVARSALISSCYGPRTGSQFHRRSKLVPLPDGVEMFPAYLKQAGYYTTNKQKEDYNFIKGEGVWDESSGKAHWSHRKPGQPFFHMESYPESHESSLHFDPALMKTYRPACDPDSVFLFPNHPDTELFRFTAAYYMDRILAVDSIVGQVIRELEESGELERTFVFYFGDNGGVLPGSKGYLYETGLHIPLVVRIPEHFRHLVDLKRGEGTDGFVSFVDFGPTLLNLAGIELPGGIDGTPFLGRGITRKELAERDITYGYADRFDEKYDLVRSVRKGNMKYMRSYQPFNPDALQNNYRYLSPAYRQWRDMYRAGRLDPVRAAFFEPRDPEALYDLSAVPYTGNS
jgi:arylsulfatase A-like enzyme